MNKKLKQPFSFLFLILFFFCGTLLFSDPFTMISAEDPLLEDLRALVRSQGKSFLSLTPPLSRDEVLSILDEIDPDSLPTPLRISYERILDNLFPSLTFSMDEFAFAVHVKAALEGRYRSNTDVPWLKKDNESQAVLALPIHLFFADRLELYLEPMIAVDPSYYNYPVSSWGNNIPWEIERFDLNFPLRAFVAAGGSWWNFQLGRDKLSFGPGRTGNLAVSDNPDYYDFARLSLFSKIFKYSILVSQMPLDIGKDGTSLIHDDYNSVFRPTDDFFDTQHRYFYLHRLDVRLFKRLSIGVSEGVMIGNSSLELRYLNPVMVFHSFFSWKDYPEWGDHGGDLNGSLFSLDVEWAFLPGWALYGQMVMNEFSMPYESSNFPDQPPRGLGFLLGTEFVHTVSGWIFCWNAELVYTDPFLYTLSTPFGSMIWMRRLSDIGSKDRLRYDWFGHREGRDMFLAALGISARTEKLSLGLELALKLQGEHGILWDWNKDQSSQKSPSGTPETSFRALFGIEYKILPMLTLSGHLGSTAIFNDDHVKGNREFGIEAGLAATFYY